MENSRREAQDVTRMAANKGSCCSSLCHTASSHHSWKEVLHLGTAAGTGPGHSNCSHCGICCPLPGVPGPCSGWELGTPAGAQSGATQLRLHFTALGATAKIAGAGW